MRWQRVDWLLRCGRVAFTLPYFMAAGSLSIKPRARILHGHEWVYGPEVDRISGNPRDGDVVALRDKRGKFLGHAIFNAKSQIIARRISRQKQDLDLDFFKRRIEQAWEHRQRHGVDRPACRVVWSESDGLPGVILDRYQDVFILQTLTKAMDDRREMIVEAVCTLFSPAAVFERNDASIRAAEGLEPREGLLQGSLDGPVTVDLAGVTFEIDLREGQKTGFYLDQVANYQAVARYAAGRNVLDMFCNQGAFSLACLKAGARSTVGIDSSEPALDAARRNALLNGLENKTDWRCHNAFDFLKEQARAGARHELVVLDPPSFTKSKSRQQGAMRGYKEIHLRSFSLMRPGDILATFTCSHHIGEAQFLEAIGSAAVDAHVTLRLLERLGQGLDHPVILNMPETEYLRGYIFELMPGR